jgi:hypothetical protein
VIASACQIIVVLAGWPVSLLMSVRGWVCGVHTMRGGDVVVVMMMQGVGGWGGIGNGDGRCVACRALLYASDRVASQLDPSCLARKGYTHIHPHPPTRPIIRENPGRASTIPPYEILHPRIPSHRLIKCHVTVPEHASP